MSAPQRFRTSTPFDHAHYSTNQMNVAASELPPRMPLTQRMSPSPAPGVVGGRPPQSGRDQSQASLSQAGARFSPALSTNSPSPVPAHLAAVSAAPMSAYVSPAVTAPPTPVLLAKELPLAQLPGIASGNNINTSLTVGGPQTPSGSGSLAATSHYFSGSASPSPSPARPLLPPSSSSGHPDMHLYSHSPRPLLYRNAHSRSNSISSTNNDVFPPSITSSPSPSPALALPSTVPPTPASRRTSLITTSLANAIAANLALSANGGSNNNYSAWSSGGGASVPMSPVSSYGLPSPTFPPRQLPFPTTSSTPARPPRSPARPTGTGALGLTPLSSFPSTTTSNSSMFNSSPTPISASATPLPSMPPTPSRAEHNYNAPIQRPHRPSNAGLGSMSRRNSRQVSVRLSAAFLPPPSAAGSRAASRAPTEVGSIRSRRASTTRTANGRSSVEVLREGDVVGQGMLLHGQVVRAVHSPTSAFATKKEVLHSSMPPVMRPSARYEVVRSLGEGSYAVVYLVREILTPLAPSASAPGTNAPGTPARGHLSLQTYGLTSASPSGDVFEEDDMFSPLPTSTLRTSSHRSQTVRRPSLLNPISESPSSPPPVPVYGRSFALKVLSKSNLAPDELAVQLSEVTIHQSLADHPNIVTLHGALETEELLMLVLEYVEGEDLYWFLEQQQLSQDEDGTTAVDGDEESERASYRSVSSSYAGSEMDMDLDELGLDLEPSRGRTRRPKNYQSSSSHTPRRTEHHGQQQVPEHKAGPNGTPTTPGLLSSVHPSQMLGYGRLKLIASMFGQMCDAVEACHSQGVSHRDIKPENFIVTTTNTASDDQSKVVVKLSDFGLATTDRFSADVDCGSAPYMSYECRNVVGPTYATQPADVWSLGMVLINMLYHHNLWQDTFEGDSAFEAFREAPVTFLMQRSPGMTREVAEFLTERVFRILPEAPAAENGEDEVDPALMAKYEREVERVRVTAGEFGEWAKNLPTLFYQPTGLLAAAAGSIETEAKRLSRDSLSLGLAHSPNCVHSQLQGTAVDDDEDDDLGPIMGDRTFTQADAKTPLAVPEGEDFDGTPVVPGLLAQSQSSPSSSSSAGMSPRSPMLRVMTPLPAEPMPLAQPVVDMGERSSLGMSTSSANGECFACTYDEQLGLGLGLTGASSLLAAEVDLDAEDSKRSPSGVRVRRRGQRRKKDTSSPPSEIASPAMQPLTGLPGSKQFDRLDEIALDAQNFAREISRTRPQRSPSRSRSRAPPSVTLSPNAPPPPALLLTHPADTISAIDDPSIDTSAPTLPPSVTAAMIPSKKPSKWNILGSWRDRDEAEVPTDRATGLLKGLDSTYHTPASATPTSNRSHVSSASSHLSVESAISSRPVLATSPAPPIAFAPPPLPSSPPVVAPSNADPTWRGRPQNRGWDPATPAVRSGLSDRWDRSPASSTYSTRSNAATVQSWRSGPVPASAASSILNGSAPSSSASSTYTRFRNGSELSFATTATSVSAGSAFNMGGAGGVLDKKPVPPPASRPVSVKAPNAVPPNKAPRRPPVNVKVMSGIPWELDELPRQMHPSVNGKMPMGHIHGVPPRNAKRNGGAPPKPPALDTISERPKGLRRPTSPGGESGDSDGQTSPVEPPPNQQKKVQKAQINTLAKILTSFKKRE